MSEPIKVEAGMSVPRFGSLVCVYGAIEALSPSGIRVTRHDGVWWHHGLSEVMEDLIESGQEYIVTLDYDTVFTNAAVKRLIEIITENAHIDALCSVQIHRHKGAVMGEPIGPATDGLLPMKQAHFGFTIFRAKSLDALPRPWFYEEPNKDGRWGEGRVPADIGFWRNWHGHGRTLYQASDVACGHMQELIIWPKKGGGRVYQHPNDWHVTNQPPEGAIGR